jgi:hypothetical protein
MHKPRLHKSGVPCAVAAAALAQSWGELLGQLVERGLSGVRLVISDEHRTPDQGRAPSSSGGSPSTLYRVTWNATSSRASFLCVSS